MNLDQRAALVRAARLELKDNMIRYQLIQEDRRMRERVDRGVQRVTRGVSRRVDALVEGHRRRQTANLRRVNMREAERIRTEGYNISPEFRQRSARVAMQAQRQASRSAAGTGINRYRGTIADIRRDANARRPATPSPASGGVDWTAPFPERRRQVRGTITYHDRDRRRTYPTRTDAQRRN